MRALVLLIAVCPASLGQASDPSPLPWRASDTTLVELCFDGLESNAPNELSLRTVTDSSIGNALPLALIGFTTTGRPIYQGQIAHPTKYRSAFIRLPNSEIWARIDTPSDLKDRIDAWSDAPIAMCTADPRADLKIIRGVPVEKVSCPDLGIHASLQVTSHLQQTVTMRNLRDRGPQTFNNLRGCRDFIHGPAQ